MRTLKHPQIAIYTLLAGLYVVIFFIFYAGFNALGGLALVPIMTYTYFLFAYPIIDADLHDVEGILRLMNKHYHVRQAQLEGCEALHSKTRFRNQGDTAHKELINNNGMQVLLAIIEDFQGDQEVLARALATLTNVTRPSNQGELLAETAVLEFLLQQLKRHQTHFFICKQCLLLISCIMESSQKQKLSLVDRNFLPLLAKVSSAHIEKKELQKTVFLTIFNLLDDNDEARRCFSKQNGFQILIQAMAKFPEFVELHTLGIANIGFVLNYQENLAIYKINFPYALECNLFDVVKDTMKQHEKVAMIINISQQLMRYYEIYNIEYREANQAINQQKQERKPSVAIEEIIDSKDDTVDSIRKRR